MNRNKLVGLGKTLFFIPMPPPYSGPEMVALLFSKSKIFSNENYFKFINSTLKRTNKSKGKIEIEGILNFIKLYFVYIKNIIKYDSVFLYINSNRVGFIRDSIYILTAYLFNKKIITQYHGGYFHIFYYQQNWLFRIFIKFILKKINLLVVLGESLIKMFDFVSLKQNICVIHNGMDIKNISTGPNRFKNKFPFTILFIGHLWFTKGFYDLIVSYKSLYGKHGSKIKLIFAGEKMGKSKNIYDFLDNKWKEYFRINEKNILNEINGFIENSRIYNAEYLGIIIGNEKKAAFNQANVFVLPSYTEGFSMACLEALSHGLPVIVGPEGVLADIVEDKRNGFVVPLNSPQIISEKIEWLMEQPKVCNQIGMRNIELVKMNFDVDEIALNLKMKILNLNTLA